MQSIDQLIPLIFTAHLTTLFMTPENNLEASVGTYEWALVLVKQGKRVARKGWNGKGMYVKLVTPHSPAIPISDELEKAITGTEFATLYPWIGLKTADNLFVPWQPSQTDMLVDDWEILAD